MHSEAWTCDKPRLVVAIRDELAGMIGEQRQRRLRIGAAATLMMRGELAEIVPLDDDETHRAAYPLRGDRVVLSPADTTAREAAMVVRLIASHEPVSVIVLGMGHDLKSLLKRRGIEYRRVIPRSAETLWKVPD